MDIAATPSTAGRAAALAELSARRAWPFAWGRQDCVTLAAAVVQAATGRNPLAALPPWRTRREAMRTLRAAGGLSKAASDALGPAIPPALARPGDIVLARDPAGRLLLAVCNGAHLLAPSRAGLAALPPSAAVQAWRLPIHG